MTFEEACEQAKSGSKRFRCMFYVVKNQDSYDFYRRDMLPTFAKVEKSYSNGDAC